MYKNQIIFDVLSKEELEDLIGKSREEVIKNNPFNNPIVKSIKKTTDINKQKLETKRILNELIDSMNANEFFD